MMQNEIKRLREARGLRQEELAKLIPMTQHALSQIEKGKRKISTDLFEQIMEILEVTPRLQVQNEQGTMDVNEYFHGEKGLKKQFPKWDVVNTGGGFYVLTKNFKTLDKKSIAVSVSPDAIMINKKTIPNEAYEYGLQVLDEYADFEEWDANREMYGEFWELCMIMLFDYHKEEETFEAIATELFSKRDLDEMLRVLDAVN